MYRKYVNARSPLRLLEKGLHGGLGIGNIGVLLAGRGVGKTSFLVGVALDELLRGGVVLHVALDQSVRHVRRHYDTIYEALASSTHLDDPQQTRTEIEARRRIHVYRAGEFDASKLADAIKVESEAGARPTLIAMDGLDLQGVGRDEVAGIRALAAELAAEVWVSSPCQGPLESGLPQAVQSLEDLVSVVLTLEPKGDEVTLRALKDHENDDLQNLRVSLDPSTLLLVRG